MRELGPWARKSQGRDAHRAFYATYITSATWFARRAQWAAEELARTSPGPIRCKGGCGKVWRADRDDLHHFDYTRLGNEAHDDLWAMCRPCHTRIHELIESSRSWRKLPKRQANLQALAFMSAPPQRSVANSLRDYL